MGLIYGLRANKQFDIAFWRTLVMGLIYGLRANKQFDIAF